jgi:hypothetical protein
MSAPDTPLSSDEMNYWDERIKRGEREDAERIARCRADGTAERACDEILAYLDRVEKTR